MQRLIDGTIVYAHNSAGLVVNGYQPGILPTGAGIYARGCTLNGNGKVYINEGTSEEPSWNLVEDGAIGPTGATGPTGPTGATGPTGPTGPTGA